MFPEMGADPIRGRIPMIFGNRHRNADALVFVNDLADPVVNVGLLGIVPIAPRFPLLSRRAIKSDM